MKAFISLAVLLLPVAAAQEAAYEIAFTDGHYTEALSEASLHQDADAKAFSARCILAAAMSDPQQTPSSEKIDQAIEFAEAAIATDPVHLEGRLQLAIAYSLKARPMSAREALRSGLGSEARDLAESVLQDDPKNHYANGFMAVWHIEVVRRGGRLGASFMGASIRKARRYYEAAIASEPDNAATHWQYAKALAALNPKKYRSEIEAALLQALSSSPDTMLEQVMQDRARILYDLMQSHEKREIVAAAERML